MSPEAARVAALAATLVPDRAESLLARLPGADPAEVRSLVALPREARLGALASALGGIAAGPDDGPGVPEERTRVRVPVAREAPESVKEAARPGLPVTDEWAGLPFDLASSAPALAHVDPGLLELGGRVARCAATGLASVLGGEASVSGRLLPGLSDPAGTAAVPVELTAIAGIATLAIDRSFAARLAGRVAGAPSHAGKPGSLSPAERTVVELAVLGALDAIATETAVESALAPRLAMRGGTPLRPLCVELDVSAAGTRGRILLVLPEAALRSLRGASTLPPSLAEIAVTATVQAGETTVDPGEARALRPGDVLLLGPPSDDVTLRLPGGWKARGRVAGSSLEVAEIEIPVGQDPEGFPVPLLVELARVSVPLGQIARIVPGAVLPLGLDRSGEVTLRVGERAVARGLLVEIDGAVGVRISTLEEPP